MSFDRQIVLESLYGLVTRPEVERAKALLDDWSLKADDVVFKAAASYLIHFVIPSLNGRDCSAKPLPRWVFEQLFEEPVPEPRTVEEWVAAFPGSCIVSFRDDIRGKEPEKHGRRIPDTLNAKKTRHGLFMTPNAMMGRDHLDEEVTELRFFFLDFDGGDKATLRKKIAQLPLKPTIVVETGKGFHAYFRLRPHSFTREEWKAVEKRMIEKEGADPQASNPARVLRMPFTWHCKSEEPFLVRIEEWTNQKYAFEDFVKIYPAPKPKHQPYAGATLVFHGLKPAPSGILVKDGRHNGLMDYLKAAYFRIRDQKDLAKPLREYTKQWYEQGHSPQKTYWEKEVDDACDFYERRQWGSVVSR